MTFAIGDKVTFRGVHGNRVLGVIAAVYERPGSVTYPRYDIKVTSRKNPIYPYGYIMQDHSGTWLSHR